MLMMILMMTYIHAVTVMGLFDGLKKAIGGNDQAQSPEVESVALIKQYEGRVARINAMEVSKCVLDRDHKL